MGHNKKRLHNRTPATSKVVVFILALMTISAGIFLSHGVIGRTVRNVSYSSPVHIPGLPACPDCNIVLISPDVFRADDLPCYGYARDTAPNICRFARENNFFTQFYSQSSFTMDDHTSMFTGLYPSTHHVIVPLRDQLNPTIPTLPDVLAKKGYVSIYAGITDDPNMPLHNGLERGFSEIVTLHTQKPGWSGEYAPLLEKLNGPKPVFLYMHSYTLHDPYLVGRGPRKYATGNYPQIPLTPEEYAFNSPDFYRFVIDQYRQKAANTDSAFIKDRYQTVIAHMEEAINSGGKLSSDDVFRGLYGYEVSEMREAWYWKHVNPSDPAMVAYMRDLYDEQIGVLDTELAPLLAYVSRPDIKRRTIVIITSDHGEEFQEHGYFGHGFNVYNTSTHVPFIIALPHIAKGAIGGLSQVVDTYPTLLSLVGIELPKPVEGKSLVSVLTGNPPEGVNYAVSEQSGDQIRSIQDGEWKYYRYNRPKEMPYDLLIHLLDDPGEYNNVSAQYPAERARLSGELDRILQNAPHFDPLYEEFPAWIDEERRQKLINRGYF